MIDLIQVLAAADPSAAAETGGIVQRFGINTSHIVMQVISFAILAAVLWKLAFKPVFATMDEREKQIDSGLRYAEEMKLKLAEAEEERKRILQQASVQASGLITEARQTAEARIDKSVQEAIVAAEEIARRSEQQIALDRKQMLAEARSEIARLVVATASKVLAKELSPEEKSRFADRASADLVEFNN